ncbi:hypothetical protein SAMN05192533_113113 [Mesobacillus persicus]|uniref:YwdI family protein n=1 Tax=Mesobacillus persicus TaxID=930146 RepID=A0A1H8GPX0_9BACI|nr:YwdI family protein [Mesobacillus persicus]SEN45774.1 hypothetical protein SAMN05192533_113113 [Mesobacillus persicus]
METKNEIIKRGDTVNISLQKLLSKMDAELKSAKSAESESALRERIHSLKTLCELVLDEPQNMVVPDRPQHAVQQTYRPSVPTEATFQNQNVPYQIPPVIQPQPQPTTMPNQAKRIDMEDGANGDSLLDF